MRFNDLTIKAIPNADCFENAVEEVMHDLAQLLISKQHDYGHGNITAFGEFGVLVRLNDKVERLKNLMRRKEPPSHESLEDTWRDIANYAIIALMLRRNTFTLPLAEENDGTPS